MQWTIQKPYTDCGRWVKAIISTINTVEKGFLLEIMICRDIIAQSWKSILNRLSIQMLMPVIVQPLFVLFVAFVIPKNITLMVIAIALVLLFSIHLAKHDLRSHLLYYWIISSITYTIIVFEVIIVSLSEIEAEENFFLILFTVLSLFFLYLTTTSHNKSVCNGELLEHRDEDYLVNRNGFTSVCPACRVQMHPRNYHCNICQECIANYDHHSYWLNCCIGDVNLHLYVAGIFFGTFALAYASLLILTTICSPEFMFGILLPEDCTDVGDNIEMCTCLVCGIYCMELAVMLLVKVIYHCWLISRGLSSFEWKEQFRYSDHHISSYNFGFRRNWIHFFKKFKKIHL